MKKKNFFKNLKNGKSLRRFFFTRKFVNFGLFMFCLIFAVKGLLNNLEEYQDTENYIITPSFQSPNLIDLPTISICLTNFIDEKKAKKYYSNDEFDFENLKSLKVEEKMKIYSSKLSIKEIENISLSFVDIYEGCELLLPDGSNADCNFLNYTKIWLSLETKCYQFFYNLNLKYSPSKVKGQFWLNLRMKQERRDGSNLGFLLNPPNSTLEPFLSNPSYFPISTSILYTIILTYTKEVTKKLEPPYNTRCKNYSHPHIDQLNCSNSCVVKKLNKGNNTFWPSNIPTDDLKSDLFFKKIDDYHILFKDCLQSECNEQDCISTRYLIYPKYEKFGHSKDAKFTIRLIYNFAPETLIRFQPRISHELSSVLSFITSPLSFFLGLAFFNIFSFLVACLELPYQIFKNYISSNRNN